MAVFGIKTKLNPDVLKFLKDIKKRFKDADLVKNPFTSYIKHFKKQNDLIIVLKMVPLWPNFPPFVAGLSLATLILFGGLSNPFLLLIPLFFLSLTFFWTENFFFLIFKAGVRKAGYKGIIKRIKKNVLIEELTRRL